MRTRFYYEDQFDAICKRIRDNGEVKKDTTTEAATENTTTTTTATEPTTTRTTHKNGDDFQSRLDSIVARYKDNTPKEKPVYISYEDQLHNIVKRYAR
jgi:hypothetical protein